MNPAASNAARTAAILLAFTIGGTALLAYTFDVTQAPIAASEEREKLALITQALPPSLFDNDLIADAVQLPPTEDLGTTAPSLVYRATFKGEPAALVFEAIAPDGYSGKIKLLVAVRANGELAGVRVVAHNETPGLGDYVEAAKSSWIRIFDGTSLSTVRTDDWRVKKDGGQFAYNSGATITPRAVVKAVHKTLLYFDKEGGPIFARPARQQEQTK
jgi:electron transport complex protein RnfG